MTELTQCRHCRKFFKRHRCAARTHGECDCPRCQGYCECDDYRDPTPEELEPHEDTPSLERPWWETEK